MVKKLVIGSKKTYINECEGFRGLTGEGSLNLL